MTGCVERTRLRPIPSGQVGVRGAFLFLAAQAVIGLVVLAFLPPFAILVALSSLGVVAIYPLMKRIIWTPQIVLGLAFSWGALMGFAALLRDLPSAALLLYAGSILWVVGYDTIYAHQDREDDAIVGVKSSARLFAEATPGWMVAIYAVAVVLMGGALHAAGAGIAALDRPCACSPPTSPGRSSGSTSTIRRSASCCSAPTATPASYCSPASRLTPRWPSAGAGC